MEDRQRDQQRQAYLEIQAAFAGEPGRALRRYLTARVDYDHPAFSEDTNLTYARLWAWHLVHDLLHIVDTAIDVLLPRVDVAPPPDADPMWTERPMTDTFLTD